MRWTPLIALALLLPLLPASAQVEKQAPAKPPKTPTSLPPSKAEPENGEAYASPAAREKEGPSDADVGPVQKHFVRASTTDDLAETQNEDNASLAVHEKIALDKRISRAKDSRRPERRTE